MTYLWILATVFFWGTSYTATKIGIGDLNPVHFLFLRLLFAGLVFMIILKYMPEKERKIRREDIKNLILLSFIGISAYFTVQYTALGITSSVNASLIIGMSPVFTALYMHFAGREYMGKTQFAGIILSFTGIFTVITGGNLKGLLSADHITGDILMFLNAVMLSYFTISAKNLLKKYNPFTVTALIHITALITLIPVVFTDNPVSEFSIIHEFSKIGLKTCFSALYLAVFCTVIGYYGWYRGIKNIGAAKTSVFNYLNPLFAAASSHIVFNESISIFTAAGSMLVLAGVFTGSRSGISGIKSHGIINRFQTAGYLPTGHRKTAGGIRSTELSGIRNRLLLRPD